MKLAKRILIAAVPTALLLGGGIAYAAWTMSGTGSGKATAGTASNLTVTVADVTGLYPGITAKNLDVKVAHTNAFPITLTGVTFGTITSDHAGCNVSSVIVTPVAATYFDDTRDIAANTNGTFTLGTVTMDNSSLDACQGATFTIPVDVTAKSDA